MQTLLNIIDQDQHNEMKEINTKADNDVSMISTKKKMYVWHKLYCNLDLTNSGEMRRHPSD